MYLYLAFSYFVRIALMVVMFSFLGLSTSAVGQVVMPNSNLSITRGATLSVYAFQSDGKIVVAGQFESVDGVPFSSNFTDVVRLDTTGRYDPSLQVRVFGGSISHLLTFGNTLYVAGTFTQINGVNRLGLARLDWRTGAIDPLWDPQLSVASPPSDFLLDSQGNLFTVGNAHSVGGRAGVVVGRIDAGSMTGQADPNFSGASFAPSGAASITFGAAVWSNALGGSIFVWGRTSDVGTPTSPATQTARLYRVDARTGVADPSWSADRRAIDFVSLFDMVSDNAGDLYLTSQSFGFTLPPGVNVTAPNVIAKIRGSDGAGAPGWSRPTGILTGPDVRGYLCLAPDNRGGLYGLALLTFSDSSPIRLSKMDASTGAIDQSFASPFISWTSLFPGACLQHRLDDVYLLGGDYVSAAGTTVESIAKFNGATGVYQSNFAPNVQVPGLARVSTRTTDGRVVIGGRFSRVDGVPTNNLLRLNVDGSLDRSFAGSYSADVFALGEFNGNLYVGGLGSSPQGLMGARRLNATNGAVDTTWNPTFDGIVRRFAFAHGTVFVQGGFSSVNGVTTRCVAKLSEATGAPDPAFLPAMTVTGFGNSCGGALAYVDGWLYSGMPNSAFTLTNRQVASRLLIQGNPRTLGRINPQTGVIDPSFDPNPRSVQAANPNASSPLGVPVLESDGANLWVGTSSTPTGSNSFVGNTTTRVARISIASGALDPTFTYLPSATGGTLTFTQLRPSAQGLYVSAIASIAANNTVTTSSVVTRLSNANGVVDANWSPVLSGVSNVSVVEPFGASLVAVGGAFNTANGQPRTGLAVLSANPGVPLSVSIAGGVADIVIGGGRQGLVVCNACAPGTYNYTFDQGSNLTVSVRPLPRFTFSGFGAGTGSANCAGTRPCSFSIGTATAITATVAPRPGIWFDE